MQLSDLPLRIQFVFESIPDQAKRIRYYRETDGDKLSYESKFKYNKHWFSLELNSSGTIEDIEVVIKKRQLPPNVLNTINSYLSENSDKFELIKIQEQYLFNSEKSKVEFINSILDNRVSINSNYEIIVAIKSERSWELKEMTFDTKGVFLNARNLQQDSYEYIMY
ncbi:hypothetical protein [uncultured Psychroserpens sp.]|uniref:hypothetical protein n=1 Tax=uncultured Psychroserpens sp. TaxID=255436 RepID=UPI00260677AF|nr:hypothetical protein [uncultured Psychroserpens sp.]